jgi:RNA polymerase sigma-70 factor (ECF subfamily)
MDPRLSRRSRKPLNPAERAGLRRFRTGDNQAFQDLVRPHLQGLLALASRQTADVHWAEDLVQEVLVRAYGGLGEFRGDSTLRTWLFRILIRLASEPQRWRRRERAGSLTDEIPDHMDVMPDQAVLSRELGHRIDEAMERLSPRQRMALHLRAVEGMDYEAIAAVLECTNAAARMLVLAARRSVLDRMRGYLDT